MRIELNIRSAKYKVQELNESDVEAVCRLEYTNPLYFEHCPPAPNIRRVLEDMKALPPGKTFEDKHYLGFFEEDVLIAVMDLILHYPAEDTAFIGFFMVLADKQGTGVGTNIINECISALKKSDCTSIRLFYAKTNPQSKAFWHKNQFSPTGLETDNGQGIMVMMERMI